jgi:hypothetical protein
VCCVVLVLACGRCCCLSWLIDRLILLMNDRPSNTIAHLTLYTLITIHCRPSVCLEITIELRKTYLFFVVASQSKQSYNLPQQQPIRVLQKAQGSPSPK